MTDDLPFGGQIVEVTPAIQMMSRRGLSYALVCSNCKRPLGLGELIYNRKGKGKIRPSKVYCLECATRLGYAVKSDSR